MTNVHNVKKIGITLFTTGVIVGITSAAKLPAEGKSFPDTLSIFIPAFIVAVVGVVLWHSSARKIIMQTLVDHKEDEAGNPLLLLKNAMTKIQALSSRFNEQKGIAFCDTLDEIQEFIFVPVVEKQRVIMDMLGQAKGAELLLQLAQSERLFNRAWSAVSDGHEAEAKSSLNQAIAAFTNAVDKL